MQNSLFAQEEFIKSSRKFVCVRIETYENEESEKMVRQLLKGKFENTSFVIFNPQGTRQLTRAARGPAQAMGRGPANQAKDDEVIKQMNRIAGQYRSTGKAAETKLQDFNSLRQALNVASADQRLLVFVNSPDKYRKDVEKKLKSVFADEEVMGKFHLNFADEKTDKGWTKVINGAKDKPSIMIVRSSQFGLDGSSVKQLSLSDSEKEIKSALLKANATFAKVEERKDYQSHVRAGKRQRVYFENEIPYGEDHNGDGKADGRGAQRAGGGGRGK